MAAIDMLAHMSIFKTKKFDEDLTIALASKMPDLASQAERERQMKGVASASRAVAEHETIAEVKAKAASQVKATLSRQMQACSVIESRMNAETNVDSKAHLNEQLEKLMSAAETTQNTFEIANKDAQEAANDVNEFQQVHQQLVAQLASLTQRQEAATRALEHAQHDKEREQQRLQEAQRMAGLKSGLNQSQIGISALEKAAQKAEEQARAAHLTAEAMKTTQGEDVEDLVAQTLASDHPAPANVSDRLAALRAKIS
jgi:chromosome segregation ATPase